MAQAGILHTGVDHDVPSSKNWHYCTLRDNTDEQRNRNMDLTNTANSNISTRENKARRQSRKQRGCDGKEKKTTGSNRKKYNSEGKRASEADKSLKAARVTGRKRSGSLHRLCSP